MPFFRQYRSSILYSIGAIIYAIVFFKNAWVSDDAYILFRSLEQLLDGNGPRWNPHERVQVFTCPLWYWLLAGMGWLHRNHYLNSILLSAACNALLLWNIKHILGNATRWFFAVILLVSSQAFFDFTSSGLENPLACCLLSFAVRFYLHHTTQWALLYCATACGLLLVTRHDLALFVMPLLLHSFWLTRRQSQPLFAALLALLLPLSVWTLFSLLYYGFPFPNTAYAKLAALVPRELLLERGVGYFRTSLLRDLLSVMLLPLGLLSGLLFNNSARWRCIAGGVLLHLAYVLWIGGDFMRGRFFSWDVLLCVLILLRPSSATTPHMRWAGVVALTTLMAASTWLWEPPWRTPLQWGARPFRMADTADFVTQERHFYYWFTAFWKYWQRDTALLHDHGWCQDSLEQRRQGRHVASANTVGFRGHCLGTQNIVVDTLGITDPLLARMPRNTLQKNWRPGHFLRLIPAGYCSSIAQQQNLLTDSDMHRFYDALRKLTTEEPLLSRERLLTIWRMNSGYYRDTLARAQQALVNEAAMEPATQQQALSDCPAIDLPADVIEKLKKAGE